MTSSEGPFLSLASGPNPKSTTYSMSLYSRGSPENKICKTCFSLNLQGIDVPNNNDPVNKLFAEFTFKLRHFYCIFSKHLTTTPNQCSESTARRPVPLAQLTKMREHPPVSSRIFVQPHMQWLQWWRHSNKGMRKHSVEKGFPCQTRYTVLQNFAETFSVRLNNKMSKKCHNIGPVIKWRSVVPPTKKNWTTFRRLAYIICIYELQSHQFKW